MELLIYTDGGSRGNPGEAAIGVVISVGEKIIHELAESIGVATNNEAEYLAISAALKWITNSLTDLEKKDIESISCYLDSKLVVEQLNKRWKIKESRLRLLAQECWRSIEQIPYPVTFSHIPREENSAADALVNQALDLLN